MASPSVTAGEGAPLPPATATLDTVLAVLESAAGPPPPPVVTAPPRDGRASTWPQWADPVVVEAFRASGVHRPWAHQAVAAEHVWQGRHVVLATGPASGKSLAYQLPVLTAARATGATALYLSPTTALAADQYDRLQRLGLPDVPAVQLDRESPAEQRRWARDRALVVLTTPDLVHHTVLRQHAAWSRFLRRLEWIVVDECHAYRGVFGAHVGAVLRRVARAARVRGATPVFVACSATSGEPAPFAGRLCGEDVVAVSDDAAPHPGAATVVHQAGGRRFDATAALFAGCLAADLQTAAFTGSRTGAEALARRVRRELETGVPDPRTPSTADRVASYRGGHLAEERRGVEARLRDGSLRGVATTSALEVGVDVTGLDVVLLDGWPGSLVSLHQRAGRAGRAGRPGVTVVVTGDDPIDAHLAADPGAVLARPFEPAVTDPDNPYVLAPHLAAAAVESPLTDEDLRRFGPSARQVVTALEGRGDLRRRPSGWFWNRREPPAVVDIRGGSGRQVTLVEADTGRLLGTVDASRASRVVHPGAVYLHGWDTYLVETLDLTTGLAQLRMGDPGWVTVARHRTDVERVERTATVDAPEGTVGFGTVVVTGTVTGYVRRDPRSGAVLEEHALDLPSTSMTTRAVWWCPAAAQLPSEDPARAGAHAAEHVLAALLPLVVPCDRHDVAARTESTGEEGGSTVVVWDAWPGGAGYAERAFHRWDQWAAAARSRVCACDCPSGCPSCVIQAGCEQANRRLDKHGAARLLGGSPPGR